MQQEQNLLASLSLSATLCTCCGSSMVGACSVDCMYHGTGTSTSTCDMSCSVTALCSADLDLPVDMTVMHALTVDLVGTPYGIRCSLVQTS